MASDCKTVLACLESFASKAGSEAVLAELNEELDRSLRRSVGHKVFTILLVDMAKGLFRRSYSSRPVDYPAGMARPIIMEGVIAHDVIAAGKCLHIPTKEMIKELFSDHETIGALGCSSSIHVPARKSGTTIAVLNLLDEEGRYGEKDMSIARIYASLMIPALDGRF